MLKTHFKFTVTEVRPVSTTVSFCSHNQVLELIKVGTLPGEEYGRGEMDMPGNDFSNGLWNLGCI